MPADWEVALAWLYVPATRPDRFAKAAAAADGVVIDLEDAVHPAEKADARAALTDAVGDGLGVPTVVRVNPPGTREFDLDIDAITPLVHARALVAIRVAKVDSAQDARRAADATAHWGLDRRLICQLESARAIRDAHEIAAQPGVHSLMLGEADLRADLGLPRGAEGEEGLVLARQTVVLAAHAAALRPPVASAYVNVADLDGLAESSRRQRALGFLGRSCIHPGQVSVVREAFQPAPADVEWARSVLDRAARMEADASGVATLADGSFIDPAVIRQAETIAALARGAAS